MRISFQVLFEIATVLVFAMVIGKLANRWWGWFLGLALLSAHFPFYTMQTIIALYAITIASLWYFLIVIEGNEYTSDFLMDAICGIALVHIFLLCFQVTGHDPFFTVPKGKETIPLGFMANQNEIAALLVLSAPAFLRPRRYLGLVPVLGAILMTKVTMGILSFLAGSLFLMLIYGTQLLRIATVGIAISAIILMSIDPPGFERWAIWNLAIECWKEHWIFGAGIGHWKIIAISPAALSIDGHRWGTLHNEPLQGLLEFGIFFPVILMGYFWDIIKRSIGHIKRLAIPLTALVVIVTNSTANFLFHIAIPAMLAITWLAILEIQLREVKNVPKRRLA